MSANKQINKLKLQNYAYEILDDGTFVQASTSSNVYFQPFKKVDDTYVPIPGHGQYHLVEAMDINWSPYTINGKQIVTSYDLISYTASAYWRQSINPTSIQISSAYNTVIGAFSLAEGSYNVVQGSYSHVEGYWNVSYNNYETAIGKYNVSHVYDGYTYPNSGNTIFSIGNGGYNEDDELHRKNIIEVRDNDKVYVNGVGNYEKSIYNDHVYSLQYILDNLKKLGHDTFYDYGNWQKQFFHWQTNCVLCTRKILGRSRHNTSKKDTIYLQISEKLPKEQRGIGVYNKMFTLYKEALFNLDEASDSISICLFHKGSCKLYIDNTLYSNDYRGGTSITKTTTEWNNIFQDRDSIEIKLQYSSFPLSFYINPYIYKQYETREKKGIYHFYTRKSEHGGYNLWHYKPIYDDQIYVKYHQHILVNHNHKKRNTQYALCSLSTYRYNKVSYNLDKESIHKVINLYNILNTDMFGKSLYVWRRKSGRIYIDGIKGKYSRQMKWVLTNTNDTNDIKEMLGITSIYGNANNTNFNFEIPGADDYLDNPLIRDHHDIGLEKIKIDYDEHRLYGLKYVKVLVGINNIFYECIIRRFFDSRDIGKNKVKLTLTDKTYTFDELGQKIPM